MMTLHPLSLFCRRVPTPPLPAISPARNHTEVPYFANTLYSSLSRSNVFLTARLVAVPGGTIGTNQCLTMLSSPTTTEYIYLHLATCGSDITPPASQNFVLDTDDFGHEITFVSHLLYHFNSPIIISVFSSYPTLFVHIGGSRRFRGPHDEQWRYY